MRNSPNLVSGGVVPFRQGASKSWVAPQGDALPQRYRVREEDEGSSLRCLEAPGVEVRIFRSFAYSEVDARKLGERVIFLDGAGQFAPTLDHERKLYNLDHHQGCLRAFTLATCEQALVLVAKGLDLDSGNWTVYANEPDLDTIFAIWVLLNYRRVRTLKKESRDILLPLLRLEGAIDANGLEIGELCGLPVEVLESARKELDLLHRAELELKKSGHWGKTDLARYTRGMLAEIDGLVYNPADFEHFTSIEEEYGHIDLGDNKVAVVCRDSSGIYEVEKRLKQYWGDRLGIIALETGPGVFTLRRSASLAGIDLERAYEQLNLQDSAVDVRPPEKRWGGSDDIGGSPRPSGTALDPKGIGKVLWGAYFPRSRWRKPKQFSLAVGASLMTTLGALGGWAVFRRLWGAPNNTGAQLWESALAAAFMIVMAAALTWRSSRGRFWLYGTRVPAGKDWLLVTLPGLAGLLSLGSWLPGSLGAPSSWLAAVIAMALLAVALELSYRGLVHGLLILDFTGQRVGGRWRLSVPVMASGLLFSGLVLLAWRLELLTPIPPLADLASLQSAALVGVGGLLAGLSLGMVRERSLSLWPGVVMQMVAAALLLFWLGR